MRKLFALALAAVLTVSVGPGSALAAPPKEGTGDFDYLASLIPTTRNGVPGRLVVLRGAIQGNNFEPGICNPYPLSAPPTQTNFPGKCQNFTKNEPVQPGEFKRAHPGQTAFTICDPCTIDGRTGSFTLKISYPNPKNLTFTNFTIQDAAGGLQGLHGQGSLNFQNGSYTIKYQFSGKP